VRPEDWARYEHGGDGEDHGPSLPAERDFGVFSEKVERNAGDLVAAVKSHKGRSKAPLLVCLCPATPQLLEHKGYALLLKRLEDRIERELKGLPGTYVLDCDNTLWKGVCGE